MTDIHIDDFYKDSAKILVQLYRQFPRRSLLFVEDISGPDTADEYGLHSDRHLACFSTMLWLADAGYISYLETVRQEALDQAVLTHKAFTLLSAEAGRRIDNHDETELPPSVAEILKTNIFQLREALKSGSSAELRRCMDLLLRQSREH